MTVLASLATLAIGCLPAIGSYAASRSDALMREQWRGYQRAPRYLRLGRQQTEEQYLKGLKATYRLGVGFGCLMAALGIVGVAISV
jgi:hypothetical protein